MVGDRLREIRTSLNLSQKEFADKFLISQNAISQYENNRLEVPQKFLEKLTEMNINLNWFIMGIGNMYYHANGRAVVDDGNRSLIQVLSAKASAGCGVENFDVSVVDNIPVPAAIVRPFSDDKVKAIIIHGDSMTPTIYSGDYVLYVPGEVKDNGIYVIDTFGELKCKRLEFKLKGDIVVISDNARYEKEVFTREDDTLRICGRVIGWIHKHIY